MRISDWSSDVCSSDLLPEPVRKVDLPVVGGIDRVAAAAEVVEGLQPQALGTEPFGDAGLDGLDQLVQGEDATGSLHDRARGSGQPHVVLRSEEHTSELQSLMRISYAVFCLNKKMIGLEYND